MSTDDGGARRDEEPGGPLAAAAATRLAGLDGLPPEEHVGVYDELHATLQAALAATSAEPGRVGPPPRGAPVPPAPGRRA